jgi:hypothetical protein
VPAGADLRAIIPNGQAETYCLAAGTYELGTNTLTFDSGDSIIGPPVTFGPKGEVTAQAFIHGSSSSGVIVNSVANSTLTIENLDISGAGGGQYGTGWTNLASGITGSTGGQLAYLTVRNSRIHDNASTGIGAGRSLVVENSEIDHNGTTAHTGYDAGIKTINYAVIHNTFFHDNLHGMWWDCDAPGGEVTGSRFENQMRAGVFIEISSGDSPRPVDPGQTRGFRILNNTVVGNNTTNHNGYSGILDVSSKDVMIDGNVATNNLNADIRVWQGSVLGHNGCSSGFATDPVTIQNNDYGPLELQGCTLTGVTCLNNRKIL